MKTLVYRGITYKIVHLEDYISKTCIELCSLGSICKNRRDKEHRNNLCSTEFYPAIGFTEYLVGMPIYDLLEELGKK